MPSIKSNNSSKGLSSFTTGGGGGLEWECECEWSHWWGVPDFLESTDLDDLKFEDAEDEAEQDLFLGRKNNS